MADTDSILCRFADADTMISALADDIVARLESGIASNGVASFVASGGTTPAPLYDALSMRDLPWEKVSVTLSDERWVSPNDDSSNEKLLRTRLLRGKAANARLVPLKTPDVSAKEAVPKVSDAVSAMPRPFDIMLLGMGDDGHTASLFPHAEGLAAALDVNAPAMACAVRAQHVAGADERLSLTLRAILDSRWIVILIKGAAKLQAYQSAMAGSDISGAPVRAVLQQSRVPVQVYWSP